MYLSIGVVCAAAVRVPKLVWFGKPWPVKVWEHLDSSYNFSQSHYFGLQFKCELFWSNFKQDLSFQLKYGVLQLST